MKYFSDFPNELGVDAAPQLQTNVELQEVDHVRLPAPFLSRCFGNWSQTNYTNLSGWFYLKNMKIIKLFTLKAMLSAFKKNICRQLTSLSIACKEFFHDVFLSEFGIRDKYSLTVRLILSWTSDIHFLCSAMQQILFVQFHLSNV